MPKERTWRHLGAFGHPVLIRMKLFRVLCGRCGVRTMAAPWARTGSVFTTSFENEVTWFVQRTDRTATSEYFGISWVTVGKIAQRVVEEKLDPNLLDDLGAIGVDEICYGRPKKYLTVVVDLLTGRVVWSAEGQSSATLGRFFRELGARRRKNIRIVAMDMDNAYEKAVRKWLKQAEIVYDRFHVVQLVTKAVDEVRRELMRALGDDPDERKWVKGSRFALLKNPWNLTRSEKEKISIIAQRNRKLYRAYLLKEAILGILGGTDLPEADREFKKWYGWARRSRLEPFRRLASTLRGRWDGIRRFLELRLSNALAEGYNSKIRLISHRAFGFHSSAALVAMIFLCCSGVTITPTAHRAVGLLHTL
jgi:transposase